MKVGVKYCGGCNPHFDRSGLVERLKTDMPEVQFGNLKDGGFALFICGCARACTGIGHSAGRLGKLVVTNETGYTEVLDRIKKECGHGVEGNL
ncbi:MAG: hypothetical protein FWE91_08075 [Defluviitaleaceae bacterium]|nr:hypothetical protein [Defluviitaleaceae bacterium]MCL2836390.1 hypothetical protein [Defluviitaleaceae bacterium]